MSDKQQQRRRRGRPPLAGEKMGRLTVNVPSVIITMLTDEAARRAVSVSELTRTVLIDWMGRQLTRGDTPSEASDE
jgi:hypothetical protein